MRQWIRMGACALTLLGGAAFAGGSSPPKLAGLGGPPLEVEEIEEPEVQEEEIEVYETPQGEVEEIETEEVEVVEEKKGGMNPGPYVLIGGGVDGFSGGLASDVNPGFAWGATAGVMAPRLGLELGYSGSVNELDRAGDEGAGSGADDRSQFEVGHCGTEKLATCGRPGPLPRGAAPCGAARMTEQRRLAVIV